MFEVFDELVGGLDANGDADELVPDAERAALFGGEAGRGRLFEGRITSVSTPPRLGATSGMVRRWSRASAAEGPPWGSKLSMPPKPRKSASARAWPGCEGRPG